jgi:hypothetical protein
LLWGRADAVEQNPVLDDQNRPKQLDPNMMLVLSQFERAKLARIFGSAQQMPKDMTVVYTEESVAERQDRCRGMATLNQSEKFSIFMKPGSGTSIERKPRQHFPGTTAGDTVMGVPYGDIDGPNFLKMKVGRKDKLFGTSRWGPDSARDPDEDEKLELAFLHSLPRPLSSEILHLASPGAIIDLAPGDGTRAMLAIIRGVSYLGVCMTEHHKEWLEEVLVTRVFREFGSSVSSLKRDAFIEDIKPFDEVGDSGITAITAELKKSESDEERDDPQPLEMQSKARKRRVAAAPKKAKKTKKENAVHAAEAQVKDPVADDDEDDTLGLPGC